jgi:(R,R)-butanediol dehydrogenase/meso-butanediol dehydrogenase/diacetyl reductase
VTRWRLGDRVVGGGGTPPTGEPLISPYVIRNPRYNVRLNDVERPPGAYAEYKLMEEWQPLPIPEGVPDVAAALVEPTAVVVHAVRASRLRLGDVVAVVGAGPIGLLTVQVARAAGASAVLVSEPSQTRREAVMRVGAAATVDPINEDVVAKMVALSDGVGPNVAFECAAARDTLQQALDMVRYRGQVVLIALAFEPVPVLPTDWAGREIDLHTSLGITPLDWRIALQLIQRGAVTLAPLLDETSYLPLERMASAFEQLIKPTTQIQLIVAP